jgi:Membrane domain of glycerophosphoryl diester phosphodiesterase
MFAKIELRRTRDFSDKINTTFEFARQNVKPLAKALIYICGPMLLIQGIFNGLYQNESLMRIREGDTVNSTTNGFLLLAYLFSILSNIAALIVVYEYLRIYEQRKNAAPIEVSEIWMGVKKNYLPLLGAMLILIILAGLGLILLVIPCIYLMIVFSLVPPLMVIEGEDFRDALSRAFKIISEKWWSTFGLIIVMVLIVLFMTLILYVPLIIYTATLAIHKIDVGSELPVWQEAGMIIFTLLYSFGSGIFQSLVFLALAFQTYNLIERKEAKGLMMRLENFGKSHEQQNQVDIDETY